MIIDLESTCWEGAGDYQRQHSEIIEIETRILNRQSGEIMLTKGILVKPVHSGVSQA